MAEEKRHIVQVPPDASREELKEIGRQLYRQLQADKLNAELERSDDSDNK